MVPSIQCDGSEHMSRVSSGVDGYYPIVKKSPLTASRKIYEFYTAPITKFWMHTVHSHICHLLAIFHVIKSFVICLLIQGSPPLAKAPSQDSPLCIAYQCCPASDCRHLRFSVTADFVHLTNYYIIIIITNVVDVCCSDIVKWPVAALCCVQAARVVSCRHSVSALCSLFCMRHAVSRVPSVRSITSPNHSLANCLTARQMPEWMWSLHYICHRVCVLLTISLIELICTNHAWQSYHCYCIMRLVNTDCSVLYCN